MDDRRLGYCVLIFLLLFVSASVGYGVWLRVLRIHRYFIAFPRIGNLRIDDPVKHQGIDVGRIRSLAYGAWRAVVEIETPLPLRLHEGYRIVTMDKGLMGDRIITIRDGTGEAVDMRDTLEGEFLPGISETIGEAWRLRQLAERFSARAHLLEHGENGAPGFSRQFQEFLDGIEMLTAQLETQLVLLDSTLPGALARLDTITLRAADAARAGADVLPRMCASAGEAVQALDYAMVCAREAAERLEGFLSLLQAIQSSEGDSTAILLRRIGKQFRDLTAQVRHDALELKIRSVR